MRDRDHQRDRRDDQHQRRNHQTGDAEKGDDGLALAGHQVDAAQRLRNPDHPCQADQNQRKRRERRAENIPVDRPHRYRTIPTSRAGPAARDQSRNRDPPGRAAIRPAGSFSHYHPFDPSTKWLRHGTLEIWLIIHAMWPCSHWRRLAAQPLTGHSAPDHALDGRKSQPKRTFRVPPGGFPTSDSPDFGGFAYVRRRQGRLRSVFRRPARHSGGLLRRFAEVRRGDPQGAGRGGQSGQARR